MAKAKKKPALKAATAKAYSPPLEIVVQSSGEVLKFEGMKLGTYTYRYIKSETKKDMTLQFTEEKLLNFIYWIDVTKNIKPAK